MRGHQKTFFLFKSAMLCVICVMFLCSAAFSSSYKFAVFNNSGSKITKILVSEDGKTWGFFDIGKGIAVGATETLVWDASSEGEDCEQYFKAVFADGSESEPVVFDFCEKGLVLEFD
ncbi:hypothetical protein G3N56_11235 [Desulfovibrio sulfodismutans]|uniref:Uncharacterized protein n=1 Tax=Desulfolutivibrio sulfodismutans TaxID=63561 RepID=A0A7K3NNF4_9BACT|nr:hypothetical protein [Desulfolutivibrio sulfodismutans]NDY57315.1 hypothetical protein [Desulfolutivibrio sulfodismutans]QLA13942.1 hypothetical protein GD606_17570 [Desulfolutivibrio sulfodismutans DSM 3696]